MNSVDDESSADDDSDCDDDAFHFMELVSSLKQPRKSYRVHHRVNWDNHVAKLLHENRFHTRYRMPLEDFEFWFVYYGNVSNQSGICPPERMQEQSASILQRPLRHDRIKLPRCV